MDSDSQVGKSIVTDDSQNLKNILAIVNNMQQALFSVGADGVILEPITKYSEKVFGCNLAGKNIMTTLYKQLQTKVEDYDAIKSALTAVIGENELQWDLTESNFPRRIDYFMPDSEPTAINQKLFKVNISPIWDENENLEKLLFVIDDITNLEKLETQYKQEQEQTGMMECILENSLDDLISAIKRFNTTLKLTRELAKSIDPVSFMDLLRNLHTMKGNSRLLKMRVLSDQIHQSEALVLEKMSEIIQSDNSTPISDELNKIENILSAHSMLIQKFLHSDMSWGENVVPVYSNALEQSFSAMDDLKLKIGPEIFDQLQWTWQRLSFKSIASLAAKYKSMVEDISNQLNKKVELKIEDDALVTPHQALGLQECLLHLIRNSIDHGIETPEDRIRLGKPEAGEIKIKFVDFKNSFEITFSDDGHGIDSESITKKAIKKGLITVKKAATLNAEEKNNLIFLPQFSTRDVATDISGRGIGMDVVQDLVVRLGGKLELTSVLGQGMTIKISLSHNRKSKNLLQSA